MLKGYVTFVCDDCGHQFEEIGLVWKDTSLVTPVKCKKCGSMHTCPKITSWLDRMRYTVLWKQMEWRLPCSMKPHACKVFRDGDLQAWYVYGPDGLHVQEDVSFVGVQMFCLQCVAACGYQYRGFCIQKSDDLHRQPLLASIGISLFLRSKDCFQDNGCKDKDFSGELQVFGQRFSLCKNCARTQEHFLT